MERRARSAGAALLGLVALAGFLRAWPVDSHGLWLDEFGTLWAARGEGLGDTWRRAWNVHGQTPLYYLWIRLWTGLVGESELTLRLPSLLAGVLALPVAFASLRRSGLRVAVAALVILGANPLLVFVSHQARPYALATLGVVLAHWGLGRALARGRAADRLLAWGGVLLAAYATPLCAPVAAALLAGVLLTPAAQRRYPTRVACLDATIAGACLVPVVLHAFSLLARRGSLQTWLPDPDTGIFVRMLPGLLPALGLALLVALARRLRTPQEDAEEAPRSSPPPRGQLVFEVCCVGLVVGGLLGGLALGINLLVARYVLLAVVAGALLQARLVGSLPWPLAAVALGCVLLAPQARAARADRGWPEWREALAELDRVAAPNEPLVIRTGFTEAEGLAAPPHRLGPWRESFLSAPVTARPGKAPDARPVLHLPFHWGAQAGQGEYFELRLVPTLQPARQFTIIAPREIVERFTRWLTWRFRGRFKPIHASRPYRASNRSAVVVVRFEAR